MWLLCGCCGAAGGCGGAAVGLLWGCRGAAVGLLWGCQHQSKKDRGHMWHIMRAYVHKHPKEQRKLNTNCSVVGLLRLCCRGCWGAAAALLWGCCGLLWGCCGTAVGLLGAAAGLLWGCCGGLLRDCCGVVNTNLKRAARDSCGTYMRGHKVCMQ